MGNYIILDHIRRAARPRLPYVYLGYWVEGSPRMQYKVRFRPLERLSPDGWQRMDQRRAGPRSSPLRPRPAARARSRSTARTKDGVPGGQQQYRFDGEPRMASPLTPTQSGG